ncbi:HAD family hydrolase [Thiothrix nivea]|uniref:HAD-superfamily hydrolase, subfamily IA, variant 3 n=1 Tax=Thiothrix nivea (strain ATCC 35100 / DSM 5205 / JP2) TaxID=870187 RepID=A0A656HAV1_THINJ|nr:HAD-IA family hydrolase [Thiothrix nivea]EIJ33383.1 HAD-superfamily hydrolase, subfamily IA, variant 3 [Thiothrix nivea DSM 5205]
MDDAIKLIAFDLFGVIITDGHLVTNGLLPFLPATLTKADIKPWYNAYTRGQIPESAFWEGLGLTADTGVRERFLGVFELDGELEQVTRALAMRYRLGILSNLGAEWGERLEKRFRFADRFAPRIISGEVKCQKPEPHIYDILLRASGLEGRQVAFIDDKLENLQAASRFGITTIHYQRELDTCAFKPDYTIDSLGELLQIL